MTATHKTTAGKKKQIFGLSLDGLLSTAKLVDKPTKTPADKVCGRIVYAGIDTDINRLREYLEPLVPPWQLERALKRRGEALALTAKDGPLWLLSPATPTSSVETAHAGLLDPSHFGLARNLVGQAFAASADFALDELYLDFISANDEEKYGALTGVELGSYRYRDARQTKPNQTRPKLLIVDVEQDLWLKAICLGVSTNLARHLVNVPAGELNPSSYSKALEELFEESETMTCEVWGPKRLAKENMGLLLAVGEGAAHGPRLVHLKYRPAHNKKGSRPLALVGKGVTFDTGGLDIKDAGSMRFMKKDMGGSAALAGFAWWLEQTACPMPCDIYLALAENAVDQNAFKPGDILASRKGLTVEIHNTDAEGRLVLADAIDVALSAEGQDEPRALIDLATLTGAMRIGLGTMHAGLFSNNDVLANSLLQAGQKASDPCWRMPLVEEYAAQLKSVVADLANASAGRFGGAITAALFLARFIDQKTPWAHFDLYAWAEGAAGAIAEAGANGQGVQCLAHFMENLPEEWKA